MRGTIHGDAVHHDKECHKGHCHVMEPQLLLGKTTLVVATTLLKHDESLSKLLLDAKHDIDD